jgi:endonuclease/exonuclease/phosphatase family metal-dependent hydrolase
MHLLGERFWPLAVLLYLPQHLFLLPVIILLPAALLADAPAAIYWTLAAAPIIFLLHVPYYLETGGRSAPAKLKVMTNNYAQNHGQTLKPFIDAQDPDILVLEDSGAASVLYRRLYPARTVRQLGQFVFIGKMALAGGKILAWPTWRGAPIAAVWQVSWQGEPLDIYSVHLPTPRGDFAKLAGLGLIKELAGRNRRASDHMSFAEAMTARVQLAREFAFVLAQEKRPFVAMGDFNMPSEGYVHRVITAGVTDCFPHAGWGFGFTFPCDTHNPFTLGQPWLRLDYVLAGPGWSVEDCQVEPNRRSKHRAVVATLSRR